VRLSIQLKSTFPALGFCPLCQTLIDKIIAHRGVKAVDLGVSFFYTIILDPLLIVICQIIKDV